MSTAMTPVPRRTARDLWRLRCSRRRRLAAAVARDARLWPQVPGGTPPAETADSAPVTEQATS